MSLLLAGWLFGSGPLFSGPKITVATPLIESHFSTTEGASTRRRPSCFFGRTTESMIALLGMFLTALDSFHALFGVTQAPGKPPEDEGGSIIDPVG